LNKKISTLVNPGLVFLRIFVFWVGSSYGIGYGLLNSLGTNKLRTPWIDRQTDGRTGNSRNAVY